MDKWIFAITAILFVIVILIVSNQSATVKMMADKIDANTKILQDIINKQNLTVVLQPSGNDDTTISEANKSAVNETGKVSSFEKPLIVDLE